MIDIIVERIASNDDGSISTVWVDGVFQCFAVEDEFRKHKVHGETRIPPGRYALGLHRHSRFLAQYQAVYGPRHVGMVHVQDVPGYEWILIHWGNTDDDTDGCLCVGERVTGNPRFEDASVGPSRAAYRRVIFPLVLRLADGEDGWIRYVDRDQPPADESRIA